jgi:hypothetical protein
VRVDASGLELLSWTGARWLMSASRVQTLQAANERSKREAVPPMGGATSPRSIPAAVASWHSGISRLRKIDHATPCHTHTNDTQTRQDLAITETRPMLASPPCNLAVAHIEAAVELVQLRNLDAANSVAAPPW